MYNSLWYENLIQPPISPPDWLFAPMWTLLYLSICISLLLFISARDENKLPGYIFFGVQLFLNIMWSPVFFGTQNILGAFLIIVLLDIAAIFTIKEFYFISKPSGVILIPYLLWLLFATYLNLGYLVLN